ncbi:MAG: hypothetical protein Q9191_001947 [Dirinaria sp. TL-2023a]
MSFRQDPQALLRQADNLFTEANSKPGFFKKLLGLAEVEDKAGDAADLYQKAATAFINQKQSASIILVFEQFDDRHTALEAAHAYKRAAEAYVRGGEDSFFTAANCYENAWDAYMKTDEKDEGFRCLETAVQISCASGKFDRAGRSEEKLGSFLEGENKSATQQGLQPPYELEKIQEAYQHSAEHYEDSSGFKKAAWKPRRKAAEYAALVGDFSKAAKMIDEVLRQMSLESGGQMQIPSHTPLGAAIHLGTGDMVGYERALDFYSQVDSSIGSNSRKRQMLLDFGHLFHEGKEDEFRRLIASGRDFALIGEEAENVLKVVASNIQKNIDEEDFS